MPRLWGGWKKEVMEAPSHWFIPSTKLNHNLRSIGYLQASGYPVMGSSNGTKINGRFARYLSANSLPANLQPTKKFAYTRSTYKNTEKAVLLFDIPDVSCPYPELLAQAKRLLTEMLRDNGVCSKVRKHEECRFNYQTTTGYGMNVEYKTKQNYFYSTSGRKDCEEFWKLAHELGCDILWKVATKVEILPEEKVLNDDLRCFEIPPVHAQAYGARCNQHFNDSMSSQETKKLFWPNLIGLVMQYGGLDEFLRKLDQLDGASGTQDVKKWDKFFRLWLRMACMEIRIDLYEEGSSGVSAAEYAARMEWLYRQSTFSYLIMPWGQILYKLFGHGMNSGDWNTTYDNELGNLLIEFMMVLKLTGPAASWRELVLRFFPAHYADDQIFKTAKAYTFLADFDLRSKFFNDCGFTLKKVDDVVHLNGSLVGLTLLGAEIVKKYGMYAPKYLWDRILAGVQITKKKKMKPREEYDQALALLILSTFNDDACFEYLRGYLSYLVIELEKEAGLRWYSEGQPLIIHVVDGEMLEIPGGIPFIPDHNWCINFWLGLEKGSSRGTSQSAGLAVKSLDFNMASKDSQYFSLKYVPFLTKCGYDIASIAVFPQLKEARLSIICDVKYSKNGVSGNSVASGPTIESACDACFRGIPGTMLLVGGVPKLQVQGVKPLQTCLFCQSTNPDHVGSKCPQNPAVNPTLDEEMVYALRQYGKGAEPVNSLAPVVLKIKRRWPSMTILARIRLELIDDIKFNAFLELFLKDLVLFEEYKKDGIAWSCCKCKAVNLLPLSTCHSCGEDVSDHCSVGVVPFGGSTIPQFGSKVEHVVLEQRRGKGGKRNIKSQKITEKVAIPPPVVAQMTPSPVVRVHNALVNEQQEVAKLKEAVKRQEAEIAMMHQRHKAQNEHVGKIKQAIKQYGVGFSPMARKLARVAALPSVYYRQAERVAQIFEEEETALSTPNTEETVNFPPGDLILPISSGNLMAFQFRDPMRNLVILDFDTKGTGFDYTVHGRPVSEEGGVIPLPQQPATNWQETIVVESGEPKWDWPVYALPDVNKWMPHRQMLPAGAFPDEPDGRPFWMMEGHQIKYHHSGSITATAGGGTVVFESWVYENNRATLSEVQVHVEAAAGTMTPWDFIFQAPRDGYYAFKHGFRDASAPLATVALNYDSVHLLSNGVLYCWAHRMSPGLYQSLTSVGRPIFQSGDLQFNNTSKILNKEGYIFQANMPGDRHWRDYTTDVDQAFDAVKNKKTHPGAKGCHCWLGFSKNALDKRDYYMNHPVYGLVDSYYPVSTTEPFTMTGIVMQDEDSRSFKYQIYNIIDYETQDTWRMTRKPRASVKDWDDAIQLLKRVPQFNSNEDHVAVINRALGFAKEAMDTATDVGDIIGKIATAF